jgi:hypothetical protein
MGTPNCMGHPPGLSTNAMQKIETQVRIALCLWWVMTEHDQPRSVASDFASVPEPDEKSPMSRKERDMGHPL